MSGYPIQRLRDAAVDLRIAAEADGGGYVELGPSAVRALADLLDSAAVGLEARGVTARMKNAERAATTFADIYLVGPA